MIWLRWDIVVIQGYCDGLYVQNTYMTALRGNAKSTKLANAANFNRSVCAKPGKSGSYICVLEISILTLSMIVLLYFGTVPKVSYYLFFIFYVYRFCFCFQIYRLYFAAASTVCYILFFFVRFMQSKDVYMIYS